MEVIVYLVHHSIYEIERIHDRCQFHQEETDHSEYLAGGVRQDRMQL